MKNDDNGVRIGTKEYGVENEDMNAQDNDEECDDADHK